jgi:cobalt-zinc-cadmium resistance protein CzcA
MISSFIRLAFANRWAVIALWGALVFVGVRAFMALPIEPFPDPDDVHVQVITFYPGKAPEEVETVISRPLEFAINGCPGLIRCRSISMFGLSVIDTTFDDATDDYFARHEIFERISGVSLPNGVTPGMQPLTDSCGEIYRYTMEGPGYNLVELKAIQDWIVIPALLAVPGVGDVNPFGGGSKEYICYCDPALLRGYGVTLPQVFQALSNGNSNGGGSVIPKGDQEYTVRAQGLFEKPREAEDVVVASNNGVPVFVRDVAHVERSTIPRRGFVAKNQSSDVIEGIVLLRRYENAVEVCKRIQSKIEELNKYRMPRGVKLVMYYDRRDIVFNTLLTVVWNDFHGLIFVFLILVFFMGDLRSAIIVVGTIPLSVLFAFTALHVLRQPINLLAFGAVDFGILCDGAVIHIEVMFVFLGLLAARAKRGDPLEALAQDREKGILNCVLELGPTLCYALGIMIVLQAPILLLERVEGRIFRPQALMTGLSIFGALLSAITLVPQLALFWLRGPGDQGFVGRACAYATQPLVNAMRHGYERILGWALKLRWIIIGAAAAGTIATVHVMLGMGTEFLPRLEEGNIWLTSIQPLSVSTEEAKKTEGRIRELIAGPWDHPLADRLHPIEDDDARHFPEVRLIISQLGRPEDGTDPKNVNSCEMHIDLYPHDEWVARDIPKDFATNPKARAKVCRRSPCPDEEKGLCEHRALSKDELVEEMNRELSVFPGVDYNFSQYIQDNVEEALSGIKGQVAIKVFGTDMRQLQTIGNKIADVLSTIEGVKDLECERLKGLPSLSVKINRALAARAGVNVSDIQPAIETGVAGAQATTMVEEGRFFNVVCRLTKDARNTPDTIRDIQVPEPDGSLTTLGEVADISIQDGSCQIKRERNSRRIGIKCSVRGRDLGSLTREAKERVEKEVVEKLGPDGKPLYWKPGYDITWEGEFESQERATERLKVIVPVSILLIYALLVGAFRSFRTALLVMVTVPLALIGGVLGLHGMGIYLSVAATMGFITLFGTAVQNGMILVARIHTLRDIYKVEFVPAIIKGSAERLRPVLMTGLTAAIGFAPSVVSHGIGAEVRKPLATVVVFGMLTSTFFTLIVLPCLYFVFQKGPVKAPGIASHGGDEATA